MRKWIGGNSIKIVGEIEDTSLISDKGECGHCGKLKEDIVTGWHDKVVYTEDNSFFVVGEREECDELCSNPILITDSNRIIISLDITPIGINKDDLIKSTYNFVSNYLEKITEEHENIILSIESEESISINSSVKPYSELARPIIVNPCLPDWGVICPRHGTELQDGSFLEPYTVEMFCSGYASASDISIGDSSWYHYIHDNQGSNINQEIVPKLYERISEESKCCEEAKLTFEAGTKEPVEEIHESIVDHLRNETKRLREMAINPLDDIGFPSTEELMPFFYKYGVNGVKLWNEIYQDIFVTLNSDKPFILNPTESRKEYVSENDITRLQYIDMVYNLMHLLEFNHPETGTSSQKEDIETAYSNLGYGDSVLDYEPQSIIWTSRSPMGGSILNLMSEQKARKGGTTSYFSNYERIISNFNDDAFSYNEEDIAEDLRGEILQVPLSLFGRFSFQSNISVLARVESDFHVPQIREAIVEDIVEDWNGLEPNLPKAVWLNPVGLSVGETTNTTVENMYSMSQQLDSKNNNSWVPATKKILENAKIVKTDIPPNYDVDLSRLMADSLDLSRLDLIKDQTTVDIAQLDSVLKTIYSTKEDMDEDLDDISVNITSINEENYSGWYTLLVVSEYPMAISGCEYDNSNSEYYTSSCVNFVSSEDQYVRGYKPVWNDLLDVDDINNLELGDLRERLKSKGLNLQEEAIVIPIQQIIVAESQIEAEELNFD